MHRPEARSTDVRIRGFTLDDYDAAVELWRDSEHMSVPPREELERVLGQAPELVLVAEDEGRVVGAVVGTDDGRRGWIFRLVVSPDHRRQRIGEALVDEVERRLVVRGATRIRLLVVGDNAPARRFWEAAGYAPFEDVVMYAKDVVPGDDGASGDPQPC